MKKPDKIVEHLFIPLNLVMLNVLLITLLYISDLGLYSFWAIAFGLLSACLLVGFSIRKFNYHLTILVLGAGSFLWFVLG